MTHKNWLKVAALALIAVGLALPACKSSSNGNGSPSDDGGTSGKGGSGGKGGAGGSSGKGGAGGSGGSSGKGGAGGSSGKGGAGGNGDNDGGSSMGCAKDSAKGCYTCSEPSSDDEFYNHCTGATCSAFDNSKLTKLGAGGKLPALP
jgi:hypothetical protein